jgi:hypothetical protein
MTMKPIEMVHKALSRSRGWSPASDIADRAGLPLHVVRAALRELQ